MNTGTEDSNAGLQRKTRSPRTVIPNGPLIEAHRKALGWTREEFEWQSHLAVERAALQGSDDGRFLARYKSKKRKGRLAGVGTTTLTNVESGNPAYAFTLKIVAETLGVPIRSLITNEDWSGADAAPADRVAATEVSIEELVRLLQFDGSSATARELATILRALLDRICRS